MSENTYKGLNANRLSSEVKSRGSVSIRLSKKRIKLVLQFIEAINKLTGQDGKEYSIFKSVILLIGYLGVLIRIGVFHRKLFQLFNFYICNNPDYVIENDDESPIIKFTPVQEYVD